MPLLDIPAELILEKNQLLHSGPIVELVEIQASELGQTLRYTSNNKPITWGGEIWNVFPFQSGDSEATSDGKTTQIQIKITNARGILQNLIEQTTKLLMGDVFIYRLVHADHLDLDPFIEETFEIVNTEWDPLWVTITIGTENWLMRRFPLNTFRYNVCRWKFRDSEGTVSPQCGYTGTDATCGRSLADCIAKDNAPRFGAFPSLQGGYFDV